MTEIEIEDALFEYELDRIAHNKLIESLVYILPKEKLKQVWALLGSGEYGKAQKIVDKYHKLHKVFAFLK